MLYVDTSAFLKMIVAEEFSQHTRRRLRHATAWSSTLLDVEAHRAARRLGLPSPLVDEALEHLTLVTIEDSTIEGARSVGSDDLRALDAIHLATALEMGDDLEALVTFDRRLAASAAAIGMTVLTPGREDDWWLA